MDQIDDILRNIINETNKSEVRRSSLNVTDEDQGNINDEIREKEAEPYAWRSVEECECEQRQEGKK